MATDVTFDPTTSNPLGNRSVAITVASRSGPAYAGANAMRRSGSGRERLGCSGRHLECRDCAHEIWKLLGCNWDEGFCFLPTLNRKTMSGLPKSTRRSLERLGLRHD